MLFRYMTLNNTPHDYLHLTKTITYLSIFTTDSLLTQCRTVETVETVNQNIKTHVQLQLEFLNVLPPWGLVPGQKL